MIDIETLSTKPNALILTIGAIKFSRNKDIESLDKTDNFYKRVVIKSCTKLNMDIDNNTIQWWNNQSKESRYETIENKDRQDIKEIENALQTGFLKNNRKEHFEKLGYSIDFNRKSDYISREVVPIFNKWSVGHKYGEFK